MLTLPNYDYNVVGVRVILRYVTRMIGPGKSKIVREMMSWRTAASVRRPVIPSSRQFSAFVIPAGAINVSLFVNQHTRLIAASMFVSTCLGQRRWRLLPAGQVKNRSKCLFMATSQTKWRFSEPLGNLTLHCVYCAGVLMCCSAHRCCLACS